MTSTAWLGVLVAIVVVGLAALYLPLQTAAEVMAGVIVVGLGVVSYMTQKRL